MNVEHVLREIAQSVEQHQGERLARLFTEDGVYEDVWYGEFRGRAEIARMVNERFFEVADDFRWDLVDPVFDGHRLYARYLFSFRSLLPEANGRRAMMEGMAVMTVEDGLLASYRDVCNSITCFVDMNFAPGRIAAIVKRQGDALKRRPEMARHLD